MTVKCTVDRRAYEEKKKSRDGREKKEEEKIEKENGGEPKKEKALYCRHVYVNGREIEKEKTYDYII